MKLGDALGRWMRSDVPPSEPEIREIERILNSLQMNNFAAQNWPTPGVINFDEIPEAPDPDINDLIREQRVCRDGNRVTRDGSIRVSHWRIP